MIRHPSFPVAAWAVCEDRFNPATLPAAESLFAVANGYLGLRGNLDEGTPAYRHGTFVNGFFESFPIAYPEAAYGYARTDQEMLNLPDGKIIRLRVDGEPFGVLTGTLHEHRRTLDLRSGTVLRHALWTSPSGRTVRLRSERLVSLSGRHLGAIRYEVVPVDGPASLEVSSELVVDHSDAAGGDDPRAVTPDSRGVLTPQGACRRGSRYVAGFTTRRSGLTLACGMDHTLDDGCPVDLQGGTDEHRVVLAARADPDHPLRLTKLLAYHTARRGTVGGLSRRVEATLGAGVRRGFDRLAAEQRRRLDRFWSLADVVVDGDPALQQAVRFALFQLHQASACLRGTGIPAKGLTGLGYEGQYFWDQEIYLLGVLTYLAPEVAAEVLRYRHATLPMARQRARTVSERGALFPWRTIDGEAASAYFPAGTAAYHINADVAHALRTYVDVTGDVAFLDRYGAEMLVETARLWASLGFFSQRRGGRFCLHGVTGPDEYTALVHNNAYTNLMAKANLADAARVVDRLAADRPDAFARLARRTRLEPAEPERWRHSAEQMELPYDEALGLHGQDDYFLDLERWDFAATPARRHPLLLHYHPLVLYRKQIVKQADLVLAMFLHGEAFTPEQKRRNFDYYDPLTTGDSSLSAPIQAIVAAEVGRHDLAVEYLQRTAFLDLDDLAHNLKDGVHLAAVAGTWLVLVYGFAGLRQHHGTLSFTPRLPAGLRRLRFSLRFRGRHLQIDLDQAAAVYTVEGGDELDVLHNGQLLTLPPGVPVTGGVAPATPRATLTRAGRRDAAPRR